MAGTHKIARDYGVLINDDGQELALRFVLSSGQQAHAIEKRKKELARDGRDCVNEL